jgi:nitroreductase
MDALETLFTRRSVRRFRPDPVERSEIEKIIEAGRLAATTKEKIGRKLGKLGTHPILLKASRRIPR